MKVFLKLMIVNTEKKQHMASNFVGHFWILMRGI